MTDEQPIEPLRIESEMQESYLTYAMSVLVDRALPDIRDGLKPVHRRILYAMRDEGTTPGSKYKKSAKIVGTCIGKYHPHGDLAVYDAMVRMAQSFSLRYTLVDGQGNFGSVDGDAAAAYRYTEARMAPMAAEMLADIQYDTVDHRDNYDGSEQEPTVLPSKVPNLLINGSSGIAVGMATNIPPHNLREVCQAATYLIDHPEATVVDLMKFIPAPDMPTGGFICGTGGVRKAYETGRGQLLMRSRVHTEQIRGADALVVTEIPYGIKLSTIIESIGRADRDGTVTGISNMHGGTVKEGIRLVLTLKRGEDPDLVLNQLWKHTNLQYSFGMNLIALDGGRPRTVSLKRMLQAWIAHRIEVIVRRTRFLLAKDEARLHIVLGLLRAIDIIDEIIALIRASASGEEAKEQLMSQYEFSDRQAQAILDMQLRKLTGLERDKLIDERNELEARIADYKDILAREERQYQIIKDDLEEMVKKHGDERRSDITQMSGDLAVEDLIEDTPCVITLTKSGYIKRLPVETYRVQKRGGKGVTGGSLKDDEDFVAQVFLATAHQYLLFFTDNGQVHWRKAYQIPEMSRTSRGRALPNILNLPEGSVITACIPVREFDEGHFLFCATANGKVKKTALPDYSRPREGGIKGVKLADDDHLISVAITDGSKTVFLATQFGQAVRFDEDAVRPTGRDTAGVSGVNLAEGDVVVSLVIEEDDKEILTICERGYGKRTQADEYRKTNRGGKGVRTIKVNERNGNVIAALSVQNGDEIMLVSRGGMVVRTRVDDIRTTGRDAAGVTVIKLKDDDALTSVARCEDTDEPDDDGAPPSDTLEPADAS